MICPFKSLAIKIDVTFELTVKNAASLFAPLLGLFGSSGTIQVVSNCS